MIKYNDSNINDWYYDTSNIIKVYKHGAVCYYKITSGDTPTPVQEPCFAVVDDITQYQDTEFEDVFNKADGKWYKLNNLNQYEEYGVYGSGRTITTYEGKLTIDGDYEYQYSGGSWVNVGDFYWVYMSQSTLTDEQVQQVIDYNEGGGGEPEYPVYYDEIQDPPDYVSFTSMTEAEAYECPWVGMNATINGDKYVFSGDSISGYEWVYQPPSACDYNFCGVDTNGNDVIINNGTTTLARSNWSSPYLVEGIVGNATTTIGMYCFRNVKSTLSALTIGNTVTTIEHEAFMETSLLTTLTIPSSVTQIDFWAFTRCTGLQEVIFEGTTPPTFTNQHDGVFHDYCPTVIYVPDSAVSAYRAIDGSVWTNESWSTNIIQPISNRT